MDVLPLIKADMELLQSQIIAMEKEIKDTRCKRDQLSYCYEQSSKTTEQDSTEMSKFRLEIEEQQKLLTDQRETLATLDATWYDLRSTKYKLTELLDDVQKQNMVTENTEDDYDINWIPHVMKSLEQEILSMEREISEARNTRHKLSLYIEVATYRPYPNVNKMWRAVMKRRYTQRLLNWRKDMLHILDTQFYDLRSVYRDEMDIRDNLKQLQKQGLHGKYQNIVESYLEERRQKSERTQNGSGTTQSLATEREENEEPPRKKQCV